MFQKGVPGQRDLLGPKETLFHEGSSPLSLTQQGSPQSSSQQENKSQQRAIKEEILNCVALKQIEC